MRSLGCLEDIDWHHGEVLIRGKGARQECLPWSVEVGAAVADYLMHARPANAVHREVFCAVSCAPAAADLRVGLSDRLRDQLGDLR